MRSLPAIILLLASLLLHAIYAIAQPGLVPKPVNARWQKGTFKIPKNGSVSISAKALQGVAAQYVAALARLGFDYKIDAATNSPKRIRLVIKPTPFTKNRAEAYQLVVNRQGITITANEPHGIFNGLQTLRQLISNQAVPYCHIEDEPAHKWRGYMVDVGRNYQPVHLLKQQIDAMALSKLNVFHFHATEHVAWRFESKIYPQLNAPEHMTSNKGMFYSEAELKDLIQYCKDRFIEFVPEIDMPGHSDAFTRAMGFGMQTEKGLAAVKQLVKEFTDTYDVKYLHLGADEVKITMPSFVPEMVNFVKSLDKQIVAWWPGEIKDTTIIRNLWFGDAGEKAESKYARRVDSRHTYLNHLDPLESVVALYFRQYNSVTTGDDVNIGATICLWPDRRIARPEDAIIANAVYPAMLSFAERTWRGGGIEGFISNIPAAPALKNEFTEFETRLLSVKERFLKDHDFTYTKQAGIEWDVFGPFDNNGNADKVFPIESDMAAYSGKPLMKAYGGTVILKHFWHPQISGLLKEPRENSTIYARTKIWSDEARTGHFWISFNNISRSPATDAPPVGKWNINNGKIWVNQNLIPPPVWQHGGEKGHSETPLTDEDYAYRAPTPIALHKGWNEVWVKVPITTFKGKDWQNPVKWMFTFAEVK